MLINFAAPHSAIISMMFMKKTLLSAAAIALFGAAVANAQAIEQPGLFDNVSIGLDGGVTTPVNNGPFFGSMRGAAGIHIAKQITPVFGLGVEGIFGVNTSSWNGFRHSSTAFDNSYVGVYATADLFNLFGGYQCYKRPFSIDALIGTGWGHDYVNKANGSDINYLGVKTGLNFNFNVSDHVTLALKPSITWNMGGGYRSGDLKFNVNNAVFDLLASVSYTFGDGFQCVQPYNQAEVDALNDQINSLRGQLDQSAAAAIEWQAKADALSNELEQCRNKAPEVVKEVSNQYNSVRFVFFRIGSSVITADQRPNVEMIADYMKSHPNAKVVVKGYASKDGNYDFNIKLAANRAESVKKMLISKYGIPADRITAEGEGIGNMFDEESWNRVSICTLEQGK